MAETLKVEQRDTRGKRRAKRLRADGKVPAVLYGHGQPAVSLSVPAEQMAGAVRHGSRVVQLEGAVSDSALIRELQFDTYGQSIVHVDFARVSADERVEVKVPLEMKGQAAGAKDGGMVELFIHEVEIECPVSAIPDKLIVNVNNLQLDDSITLGEISLPEGVVLVGGADEVAVHCVKPHEEAEEAATGETDEPELIRKEKEAEAEEE